MYACYNSLRRTIKRKMKGGNKDEQPLPPPPSPPVPVDLPCQDDWGWNPYHKSEEVRIYGAKRETAHFHPNWSNGTVGRVGEEAAADEGTVYAGRSAR